MKSRIKSIYSILIILSIVMMFLPIGESVDNSVVVMQQEIRSEEAGMERAVDKLTRENDKVQKAADKEITIQIDEELSAAIDAKAAEVQALSAKVTLLDTLLSRASTVRSLEAHDATLAEDVSDLIAAIETQNAVLKEALNMAASEKAALDKQQSDYLASQAFIPAVETIDEAGNVISLKDLLQSETEQFSGVFDSRPENGEAYMSWKLALDNKRSELDASKAEGGLSAEEEAFIEASIADSDERYIVMIKILRQQVAIDEMAADPTVDADVVAALQKTQDDVYKQIGKVNKEQSSVNKLIAEMEALKNSEALPSVEYALLPKKLPLLDNLVNSFTADIEAKDKEIQNITNSIAATEEIIASATDEIISAAKAEKAGLEEQLHAATASKKELESQLEAAKSETAAYKKTKPSYNSEENKALENLTGNEQEIIVITGDVKKLDEFIDAAVQVSASEIHLDYDLSAIVASAEALKNQFNANTEAIQSEISELNAVLEDPKAAEADFNKHLSSLTDAEVSLQTAIDEKAAEIASIEALIKEKADFIDAADENLDKTKQKKIDLEKDLAAANAAKADLEAALEAHKAEINQSVVKIDMSVANASPGQAYPTILNDYYIAAWTAVVMLALALILVWIPRKRLVSKFYTLASAANLIAILCIAFSILRLKAIPIALPYSNPSINGAIAIPMIAMPLIALLIHCSNTLNTKRTMIYVLCISLCVLSLIPFWLMIVNATRNSQQIQGGVSLIPSTFLSHNWQVLQRKNFDVLVGFKNSAIIAFGSTLLSVYFSALTAYGLTVYKFKGAKFLYAVILAIIMVPGQVTATGFYMFMYRLGWTNSYLPLIIPSIAAASTVFFFKQYLAANFQVSLVEAARIDGAGEFYTYNKIVMPIMVPAMATMGIMAVIGSWNNYLTPLMLLSKTEMKTLPMMVKELRGDIYRTEYGSIYLGLTLTALPLLIVYFSLSKYIIAGVAVGGVKE